MPGLTPVGDEFDDEFSIILAERDDSSFDELLPDEIAIEL